MKKKSFDNPASVLGSRAAECVKRYKAGTSWDEIVASEALMLYSEEFRAFVASKCNVDPTSGKPLDLRLPPASDIKQRKSAFTSEELEELKKADAEIDAEEGAEEKDASSEEETEEEEAEEEEEEETEAGGPDADEADAPGEDEEEEVNESVVASHNDCHWCGAASATVCLSVQAQDGEGENRLVRLDHLCENCAMAYWTAIHNAQKERMF